MMSHKKRFSSSTVTPHDHHTKMVVVNQVAADVREQWNRGESPNLATLLATKPELKANRSVFLDLAHEEFCRRIDSGESLDTDEFCRQFPSFQSSLCMLIEVNRLLDQDPRRQSVSDPSDWPKPGESFLGYSLIAEIGRGSFARVFVASEPALGGRAVVLKVAPHGGGEAELAGKLQHPNIVPIHSIKEDPKTGLTAICMPYLGRATLCDVLDRAFADGPPPVNAHVIGDAIAELRDDPSDALDACRFDRMLCRGSYVESVLYLVAQIADALAYTHARGICHRDMKPSNVLLSVEGRPLLLDFNLSADGETNVWQIGGTLPYMASEHLYSVVHKLDCRALPPDPRSDLFSLGVITYQLLSGTLPFGPIPQGSSIEEVAERLLERHVIGPRSLCDRNRLVDRQLEKLIKSCLALDPDDRPQSANDLANSFRRQLTLARRARRWVHNHPRRVFAGASVVLTFLMAGATFLVLRDPFSIRQYQQALHYAEQGQLRLAAECLDRSVEANPNDPEVFFARGRVRQKLELYDMAAIDFYQAEKMASSGELEACEGFCASKLRQHKVAITHYRTALESGFQSPVLLNNLGYECIQLGRHDEAERYLKEALKAIPDFQTARNNLVVLHARRATTGESITESMLTHARRTVEMAKPSGELYFYAAILFGRAGKQDPRWVEPAREYLRLAIAHRVDPRAITSDTGLSWLCTDRELQALRDRPVAAKKAVEPVFIVDPIESGSLTPFLGRSSP